MLRSVFRGVIGEEHISTATDRLSQMVTSLRGVRTHDGHPLNEAAHRLAVAARRCHNAKVSPAVATKIANNIAASIDEPHSATSYGGDIGSAIEVRRPSP